MFRDRFKRALPAPPASLLAAAVSFAAIFGGSVALGADSAPGGDAAIQNGAEQPGMYPATPRIVVGSGTISGVGEYQLLHSRDYRGGLCVGLLLKGQAADGSDVLSEGCGGPREMNLGRVTAGDGAWTIVHGRVPANTNAVRVQSPGRSAVDVPAVEDGKGVEGKFAVKKLDGDVGLEDLEFTAVDAGGRTVASQKAGG